MIEYTGECIALATTFKAVRQLSLYGKVKSLFYPVLVRKGSSEVNTILELYLFRGRYQLATADALYSDGNKYRPLVAAFSALKKELPKIKNVLVLGTGLGSAVHVAYTMGYQPHYTLVDLDQTVLDWAIELLPGTMQKKVTPVCANAANYIAESKAGYDLIIIDVFIGREVPLFVTTGEFLGQCRQRLNPNGKLVMNYMVRRQDEQGIAKKALEKIMGKVYEIAFGLNRVYICI